MPWFPTSIGVLFPFLGLHGRYPDILNDAVVGEQATDLFADAQVILTEILDKSSLQQKVFLVYSLLTRLTMMI